MSPDNTTISILIIDGDDQERQYYAKYLKLCSPEYVIYQSSSAKTGMDVYNSHPVDCIVLELLLPDASGFEVLHRLTPTQSRPEIVVVVLTGLNSPPIFDLVLKNGAHAVLHKAHTSGAILHKAVLNAVVTLRKERKEKAI